MKISNRELILLLRNHYDWYEASAIADVFGVSTKTVTNYVKRINDYRPNFIISSNKGYMLNREYDIDKERGSMFFNDDFSSRVDFIIKKLLFEEGRITTYNLADSLYISDSHLEMLLKHVKKTLMRYDLSLTRKRNVVKIEGSELNKRRMISIMMENENANFTETSSYIVLSSVPDFDIFVSKLSAIFDKNNVYINDYNFNTLIVYIVIMVDRIRNNNTLENDILPSYQELDTVTFYSEVKEIIESFFRVSINSYEYHYLCLIIKNNSNIYNSEELTIDSLRDIVPKEIFDKTLSALFQLENYYHLTPADDNFKIKFILHTMLMFDRINSSDMQYNQLLSQIKSRYPFVYDMAIYFVKAIFDEEYKKIPESELGFLAIHLGTYLENSTSTSEKLKTCFVYVSYHNYFFNQVEEIEQRFKDSITIVATVSVKYINRIPKDADLIISNYPLLRHPDIPVLYVDEFISNRNLNAINDFITKAIENKRKEEFKTALLQFTSSDLFYRNLYIEENTNIITYLVEDAHKKGYCEMSFKDEVLDRERMSSTSFESSIAVAHSLYHNCTKSFMSVCINEEEVYWDDKKVNIILLIGSTLNDEYMFRSILDNAIPFLSERHNVLKLLACSTYDEFIKKMLEEIYPENE